MEINAKTMETRTNIKDLTPTESNTIHVGEHLEDLLDWVNEKYELSMREFAQKAEIPVSQLSEVLNGKRNISPLMALKIERATGTPKQIWGALQWGYELDKILMRENTSENQWQHDPAILQSSMQKESA
jgi:addiction module HigA family antidote